MRAANACATARCGDARQKGHEPCLTREWPTSMLQKWKVHMLNLRRKARGKVHTLGESMGINSAARGSIGT